MSPQTALYRRGFWRPLRWLGDLWLAFGLALVCFLILEGAYRGQAGLRWVFRARPASPKASPLHPYAGERWFREELTTENRRERRYDPYRGYWAMPYASPYRNIDWAGRRVTVQPAVDSATALRVFMLGGSSMFGVDARDAFTIPSRVSASLGADGISNVEVVNLAQPGFAVLQGAATLLFELVHGRVPAVAVFLDGRNDIAHTEQFGESGRPAFEPRFQSLLDLGSRGFAGELVGLGRHSRLILRLQTAVGLSVPARRPAPPSRREVCDRVAVHYREVTSSIEGLGRGFGFSVLFLLQPMHATTGKRLTAWERSLKPVPILAQCARSIDSVMAGDAGRTYYNLSSLFDADTASVYLDPFGHVTEAANGVIAERIAELIRPLLIRPVPAVPAGPRPAARPRGSRP